MSGVREDRSTVEHGFDRVVLKDSLERLTGTNVALDRGQIRMLIFIWLQVDADAFVPISQQSALENSAEKSGATSNKVFCHGAILVEFRSLDAKTQHQEPRPGKTTTVDSIPFDGSNPSTRNIPIPSTNMSTIFLSHCPEQSLY